MAGDDKRKQSLYFPEEMLAQVQAEAARQDRSLSWIMQQAWLIAQPELQRYPAPPAIVEAPRPPRVAHPADGLRARPVDHAEEDAMSWPIRYHEERPEHPQVGDMWPAPWLVREGSCDFFLSEAYRAARAAGTVTRMPLIVRLPDGTDFCVDGPCRDGGKAYGGWTVTGDPPAITLSPSIDIVGWYHGWIQNGVITDDCEGRKFP